MRHGQRGRKLGRTASHKKAMLNNMATSLFDHGKVRTTLPKAKELRGVAERLISFAKRGDLHARRQVLKRIQNKVVLTKLFDEIGPSFSDRSGGYTRILKLGPRRGDNTELCLLELVGDEVRSDSADAEPEASAAAVETAEVEESAEAVEASAKESSDDDTEAEATEVVAETSDGDSKDDASAEDGEKKDA